MKLSLSLQISECCLPTSAQHRYEDVDSAALRSRTVYNLLAANPLPPSLNSRLLSVCLTQHDYPRTRVKIFWFSPPHPQTSHVPELSFNIPYFVRLNTAFSLLHQNSSSVGDMSLLCKELKPKPPRSSAALILFPCKPLLLGLQCPPHVALHGIASAAARTHASCRAFLFFSLFLGESPNNSKFT